MSTVPTEKQIANANKPTLVQWAINQGVELEEGEGLESIRKKLRDALGLSSPAVPLIRASRKIPVLNPGNTSPAHVAHELELLKIRIHTGSDGINTPVFVGVNGERWQINRDVDVVIPRYVYRGLLVEKELVNPDNGEHTMVSMYSVSLLGAVDGNGDK